MRTVGLQAATLASALLLIVASAVSCGDDIAYRASADAGRSLAMDASTAPPSVVILSPAAGTTFTSAQTVSIAVSASDDVAVTNVELYNGARLASAVAASSLEHSWTISEADNGDHIWTAAAYDADGHRTVSAPVTTKVTIAGAPTTAKPVGVDGDWTLAFDDEFDGTELDTTKWDPHWFSEGGKQNNVGTYASNVAVSGGNLILTLASGSSGASVNTQSNQGFAVLVGMYAEARVSFPANGSKLYNWPAWWISGASWPKAGEHDIAEVFGGQLTVNYHSPSGAHNQGAVPGSWGNAFHVYGVHRKATSADVYWDGTVVKSYTTDDNGGGQYLILNVGHHASPSAATAFGADSQMKVDYVRVWK